jgi:DNA gyrase/topoisomerase IV subunit A
MTSRDEDLPLEVEIAQIEARLEIYDAITVLERDPRAVLEVLLDAGDSDVAVVQLRERFGWTEIQALAVLDLQFRRATRRERRHLEETRQELVEHLTHLRGLDEA